MSTSTPDFEKGTITTDELLERSARSALNLQRKDGSFPPGRNGVYDEPVKPIRTTSHWLTTLSNVYEIAGDEVFAEAANDAADYLLSDEARPYGYTFHARNAEGKDKCNGLMGQATPIQGLARGGIALKRPELVEIAEEVFSLHPFDEQMGLWERVEIDGTKLSFDRTLNHQIAFAAACAELVESGIDTTPLEHFLDRLDQTIRLRSDGLIRHYVRPSPSNMLQKVVRCPEHRNLLLNEFAFHYHSVSSKMRRKEIGYHPYNLRALARLKQVFPEHSVWECEKIQKAHLFIKTKGYCDSEDVFNVRHGSMTPGIHAAYALFIFRNSPTKEIRRWIVNDIERRYDFEKSLFVKNAIDPAIQPSTIYDLYYLPDIEIDLASVHDLNSPD